MTAREPLEDWPDLTLEGTHVRLEPLTAGHAPALLSAVKDQRETYGFTWVPATAEEMDAYIAAALAEKEARQALPFATIAKATGTAVGSTRFGKVEFWQWPEGSPHVRADGSPDAVEIGWTWLAESVQRTAVNTEAKLLMLTHAFEVWRVHRVSLMTDERNERSRRAILRIGARFDGVLRGHRVASDGGVRNTAAFSILADEWPGVREMLRERVRLGR
jgi:N-acetyltransferase